MVVSLAETNNFPPVFCYWVEVCIFICDGSSTIFTPEKYNVKAEETSVSGLSSGGYMAVQFHVAFSGTIRGAGITAGGIYSP